MLSITTSRGIHVEEIDTPKYAKEKFLFNITEIPHDERRPAIIDVVINGKEYSFEPEDGWAQVSAIAHFGPNEIVFKNLDDKPIVYKHLVRYMSVRREGKQEILDYKKEEHTLRRHRRMNWNSLVTH